MDFIAKAQKISRGKRFHAFSCIFKVRKESESINMEQALLQSDDTGIRHPNAEISWTQLVSSLMHLSCGVSSAVFSRAGRNPQTSWVGPGARCGLLRNLFTVNVIQPPV